MRLSSFGGWGLRERSVALALSRLYRLLMRVCMHAMPGETIAVDGGNWLYTEPPLSRDIVKAMSTKVEAKSRAIGDAKARLQRLSVERAPGTKAGRQEAKGDMYRQDNARAASSRLDCVNTVKKSSWSAACTP